MEFAVKGALIGLGIGIVLVAFEYIILTRTAKERAQKLHREPALEETEKVRIKSLARFALVLPILCGGIGWLLWG